MNLRVLLCVLSALVFLVTACAPAAQPSPAAPAKEPAKPAAAPTKPAAAPAAKTEASPAAKPAASPAASPGASPVAAAPAGGVPGTPLPTSSWQPERPIEFVVQAAAGGGSDIYARTTAEIMTKERLVNQPINVVNKPGGSGAVAYSYLAEKRGDPHVIATITGSYLTTPIQGKSPVSYKDFTNLVVLAAEDYVAVVRADSPYNTLKDLVEAAKARPSGIRVGVSSVGSSDSILTNRLEKASGTKFNVVVFQSGGEINAALLGGSVDVAFPNPSEATELMKAGRLKPLALFSPERLKAHPDIPTAREQGYDVTLEQFRGVAGAGGITEDQKLYWYNVWVKVFNSPGFQSYLETNGLRPLLRVGDAAEQYIAKENEDMTQAMKDLGIIQ